MTGCNRSLPLDAHIHLALEGAINKSGQGQRPEDRIEILRRKLLEYKKRHVCILRDGGDKRGLSLIAREIAREEGLILRSPGCAFSKKGHYGSFLGQAVRDTQDFKEHFDLLLKQKPDHLKIILTGLVDFTAFGLEPRAAFSSAELRYMVLVAGEYGLPVMVHANSAEAVGMAVKAGAHSVEHGFYLTSREMYLMAEHNTVWVPTLSPLGNILERGLLTDKKQQANLHRIYSDQLDKIGQAMEIGVRIAVGSDAGAPGVDHGQGFFDEVRHLAKAGVSQEKIYEMAWENGLYALGLDANTVKEGLGHGKTVS